MTRYPLRSPDDVIAIHPPSRFASGHRAGVARRESGWREDLRLFLSAWAAGFLFFMILIG